MKHTITVFYDSRCPLCAREIAYYKRIDTQRQIHFQPLIEAPGTLLYLGVSQVQALQKLHALDTEGRLHIGVDAFILIWQQLPHWRALARVLQLPLLKQIAEFTYDKFAVWRFSRLTHCTECKSNND